MSSELARDPLKDRLGIAPSCYSAGTRSSSWMGVGDRYIVPVRGHGGPSRPVSPGTRHLLALLSSIPAPSSTALIL